MSLSTDRAQHIRCMYAQHDEQLHRVVARRGSQNLDVVDDACQHAWAQLLAAEHVDLTPPRWQALGWLTTTAVRHAWQHGRATRRATPVDPVTLVDAAVAPSAGEVYDLRSRLEIVRQLPERPRRFLLLLAVGHTYQEISEREGVSYTTTNRQIARAKRLLRRLEAESC